MEEKTKDFLAGRVRDLATRAYMNSFVTHTDFLSVSEQACIYQILAGEGVPAPDSNARGSVDSSAPVVCAVCPEG